MLSDNAEQPLDALNDAIEKTFKKRSARTRKPPALPKTHLVDQYAADLRAASDDAALNETLGKLAKDKTLTAADIKAVANTYRGTTTSYKNKTDAIAAIRKRFLANQRDVAKAAQIKEMF